MRESVAIFAEDGGFNPVFTTLVLNYAAFHANRFARRHGSLLVHFQMPRHGREAASADRLAHGFIQKRGNASAVQKAGMPLKAAPDCHRTHHGAVASKQKLQLQSLRIGFSAAEAAILRSMG